MPDEATISVVERLMDYGAMGILVLILCVGIWWGVRRILDSTNKANKLLGDLNVGVTRLTDHIDNVDQTMMESRRIEENALNSFRGAMEKVEDKVEHNGRQIEKVITTCEVIKDQNNRSSL